MDSNKTPAISEADKLNIFIVARLSMIEATLALLWNNSPNREALKALARTICEVRETSGLNSNSSEEALRVDSIARQQSFDAIFHELPQAQSNAAGHNS